MSSSMLPQQPMTSSRHAKNKYGRNKMTGQLALYAKTFSSDHGTSQTDRKRPLEHDTTNNIQGGTSDNRRSSILPQPEQDRSRLNKRRKLNVTDPETSNIRTSSDQAYQTAHRALSPKLSTAERNRLKRARNRERREKEQQAMAEANQSSLGKGRQQALPTPPPSSRDTNSPESPQEANVAGVPENDIGGTRLQSPASSHDEDERSNQPTQPAQTMVSANGSAIERFNHDVWHNIISRVLLTHRVVKPMQRKGMLAHGLISETLDDAGVIKASNVDLDLFGVCKTFAEIGRPIYYGTNVFHLSNPNYCI